MGLCMTPVFDPAIPEADYDGDGKGLAEFAMDLDEIAVANGLTPLTAFLGDFEDVPEELVGQIRDKRFDAVSSEIYFDLKRDRATLPLALRAVAVLGAHPPAVGSMKPLSDSLAGLTEATKFTG